MSAFDEFIGRAVSDSINARYYGSHEETYVQWLERRNREREEDLAATRYEEQQPNHVFVLVYLDGHDVFASCSCEWTSEVTKSSTAAERLAEGHAREVGDL